MAGNHSEPVYPMTVAERLTGLSRRQIRYYEKRGLLRPFRTPGGHRLCSPDEIQTLLTIKLLTGRGYRTIEAVRRRLAALDAAHGSAMQIGLSVQPGRPATAPAASGYAASEDDSRAYFGRNRMLQSHVAPTALSPAPARLLAATVPNQAGKGVQR